MTNRREFLRTGAAVSALAMNGLVARDATAAGGERATESLHKAIYDNRYVESLRFAAYVAEHGVAVRAIANGDVTGLWYDELDLLWREQSIAIAGSTQLGPLFVLETLARERGLGVVLRVEHHPQPNATIAHVITAASEVIAMAERLSSPALEWPALMATLACRCQTASGRLATATFLTPGKAPMLTLEAAPASESLVHYYTPMAVQQGHEVPLDGRLVSWVIAPAAGGLRGKRAKPLTKM
jgi:hypothetical protein